MAGQVDDVGVASDEGGCEGRDGLIRPDQHGADPHSEPVGELARAAEQLQADLGRRAVVLLHDDPDVVARGAVHGGASRRLIQGCAPR